jgi:hypothetical protein
MGPNEKPVRPHCRLRPQVEAGFVCRAERRGGPPNRQASRKKLIAWRDRGEHLSAGTLQVFQRFGERLLVAGIELNLVSRIICLEADGFANDSKRIGQRHDVIAVVRATVTTIR